MNKIIYLYKYYVLLSKQFKTINNERDIKQSRTNRKTHC